MKTPGFPFFVTLRAEAWIAPGGERWYHRGREAGRSRPCRRKKGERDMEQAGVLLAQLITMFLYVGAGWCLCRARLVTTQNNAALTNLLLYVILPCVIVRSFLRPAEESSIYGASVGHSLVIPTFTLTNKDRSGSISVADSFDWPLAWSVSYDGNEYPIMSFDLNSNDGGTRGIRLSPAAIINSETGDMIEKNDSSNYLLSAGETVSFRTIGILNMEPASWDDGFDLIIDIPNSSGEYESFTYSIPEES